MSSFVRNLSSIRRRHLALAGGKAVNLGEMMEAGLPVPDGFVILTSAYRTFIEENGLQEEIEGLLTDLSSLEARELERTAEHIRRRIVRAVTPDGIRREIDAAYGKLGEGAVAVRSSATAEDLPDTSFAGQYSSYLNISGREELVTHIRRCWASLWNYRALSYRLRRNAGGDDPAHGVVVQRMVDAGKSGVLFTANPVNGRRDQMLLDASWGLGELIVGGEVTPDEWVITHDTGRILRETIADKVRMTVQREGGVCERVVPGEWRSAPTLDDGELSRLHELGKEVQRHFGFPQDIEWAHSDGEFFLVQTRPITSLYPLPQGAEQWDDLRVYVNFSLVSQGMHEPLTPMGESIFLKTFVAPARLFDRRIVDERDLWWLKSVGGRVFMDMTELLRDERRWEDVIINDVFSDQEPVTAEALLQFLARNREEITSRRSRMMPWLIRKLIPLLRIALPMGISWLYGILFPLRARAKAFREWGRTVQRLLEARSAADTIEEKLQLIERHVGAFTLSGFAILSLIAPSVDNAERAQEIAGRYLEDTSYLQRVKKSVPHNITTEMGVELMEVARSLAERDVEPDPREREVAEFLQKYGHKSNEDMDVGIPRWAEEPEYVLDLIRLQMRNRAYEEGLRSFYRGAEEAKAAIERAGDALRRAGASRRVTRKVVRLLRTYRETFGLREQSKFVLTQMYQIYREMLREVGEELAAQGRLDRPDDVFLVRFTDVRSDEPLQETVRANRRRYDRYTGLSAPRIMTSTGECIHAAAEESNGALAGVSVSAGVYEGEARVLDSPEQGAELRKGEILVTRATSPAWTPLFVFLGAIIMEAGGPISHGSVVAREYGIPAVIVPEATNLIRTGERIRVDGDAGTVRRLGAD